MAKLLKQYQLNELGTQMEGLDGAVIVHYQGLNSQQEYNLRKELRDMDARLKVVRASIARVHLRESGYQGDIDGVFVGPVAFVTSVNEDQGTIGVAREMIKLIKKPELKKKIKIQGALFDGQVLPSDEVEALSKMPTREQLLARLAGAIEGPTRNFATVIKQIPTQFASVLSALQKKKEEEEGGA